MMLTKSFIISNEHPLALALQTIVPNVGAIFMQICTKENVLQDIRLVVELTNHFIHTEPKTFMAHYFMLSLHQRQAKAEAVCLRS